MAVLVDDFTVHVADRISAIDADEWDACAGKDPFTCHAHLLALEESGSAAPASGFQPSHVTLLDSSGRIAAAAPAYIKQHSEAEIGADMGWNLAHDRFCGPYYPKLQIEVPFCPFAGPRLLVRPGLEQEALRQRLLKELIEIVKQLKLSSLHIAFMTLEERDLASQAHMMPDIGTDFVWENNGYSNFDDFLAQLKGDRRRMIRYEEKKLEQSGLSFQYLTGKCINDKLDFDFFNIYSKTYKNYGQKIYLNEEYFSMIFKNMKDNILIVKGIENNSDACGCLCFFNKTSLYIQHWGSKKEINFAHFATSYYQTMRYAIQAGLPFIDAGANGRHKVPRGMLPVDVHHAHWFRNEAFGKIAAKGLRSKFQGIRNERNMLMQRNPFRS